MWSESGDGVSDEAVQLYQPITYGRKTDLQDPTCSYVGGGVLHNTKSCQQCGDNLQLLVHIYVPNKTDDNDRLLEVHACNRASCYRGIYTESFCNGGGGVVVATSSRIDRKELAAQRERSANKSNGTNDKKDGWNMFDASNNDDDNDNMDDLEAKLSALEASVTTTKKSASAKKKHKDKDTTGMPAFELHTVREPPSRELGANMDEDDVGLSGGNNSSSKDNDKIQQMLARYMAEEDDQDIVSMLKNGSHSGGRGVRDERLSPQDRAMLAFSDRLKRSPRQVVRKGGEPLWSIAIAKEPKGKAEMDKDHISTGPEPVPKCSCGSDRIFELQILPSLLHVLNVDKYAWTKAGKEKTDNSALTLGGMNFGNIAVYCCQKACGSQDQVYVAIQEAVDDFDESITQQKGRIGTDEPIVIDENAQFDVDEAFDEMDDADDDDDSYNSKDDQEHS